MNLPSLYAIIDQEVSESYGWKVPQLARAFLAGGAQLLQVRVSTAGSGEFLSWCDEVIKEAKLFGAKVIINNRADVASLAGADGVHVGQDDLSEKEIRTKFSGLSIVGISTHTIEQLECSIKSSADYIAVGPIYKTSTKETELSAIGVKLIEHAVKICPNRPIVAIGGITLDRVKDVIEAGASTVAVISDLLVGKNPEARVRSYLAELSTFSR